MSLVKLKKKPWLSTVPSLMISFVGLPVLINAGKERNEL